MMEGSIFAYTCYLISHLMLAVKEENDFTFVLSLFLYYKNFPAGHGV